MRLGHGHAALQGDQVNTSSASDPNTAAPGPRRKQPVDEFPALGSSAGPSQRPVMPDRNPSPSRSDTRVRDEQRGVAGWAHLLRPKASVSLPADPPAQSDLQPRDAALGAVEGASGADALPARARKAAAADQLLAEARRSVVDAMTGLRVHSEPAVLVNPCP